MKFSAQEEYGLRCILNLARGEVAIKEMVLEGSSSDGSIRGYPTVSQVAADEGISVQYVRKLFGLLAKAGLIEGVRGCKGGFQLSRPIGEITVAEVLQVLGGRLYESETCGRFAGDRKFCVHNNDCSIRSLWSGLQVILDGVLEKVSLKDLTGNEKTMGEWIQLHSDGAPTLEMPKNMNQVTVKK
jgi:Rrf2 family protein